ncbi:hypothetical protein ES705_23875 [subsurface metagenome]
MATSQKSIGDLLTMMDQSELVLPEIQRDFVWNRKNVLLLFDSLYRGLPIGYMLVWKAKTAVASKSFKKTKKLRVGQQIDRMYGYLLDGQQRLTAIQLVRDGHDDYPLMFSLWIENSEDTDADRFYYRNRRQKQHDPWCIPVSDILNGLIHPLNVIETLKNDDDFDYKKDADRVYADITKLQSMLKYGIGLIEFEEDDYRKATELFIRFNATGKRLKRSDLVAADLALTLPSIISNYIIKARTKFTKRYRFNFTNPFLIQCLAAVRTGHAEFKKNVNIWANSKPKQILKSWQKTELGIDRTIEFITGVVKWDSDSWLPSINALIPLIYIFSHYKLTHNERLQARKWLHQACIHAAFSGSVYSELDRLLRGLSKECSVEKLLSLSKRTIGRIHTYHFDTNRRSGPTMALYISMLRDQNSKDWINRTSLDGTVVGHNAELQIHHFFPKALLKAHGYSASYINNFGNYTIISKNTNLDIRDTEPYNYIKDYRIRENDLVDQCIPNNKNLWRVRNYTRFLEKRRKLLAKACNSFLEER